MLKKYQASITFYFEAENDSDAQGSADCIANLVESEQPLRDKIAVEAKIMRVVQEL